MNKLCPKCEKNILLEDGGVQIKEYLFCTPNCLFGYFSLQRIKQLFLN